MAISVKNLSKTYRGKDTPAVEALKGVTFALPSAGLVFILGKSGCGKTTLMNMIGGLDSFDSGDLTIDGRSVKSFSDGELVEYRNRQVGFVYQENNLLDEYTVERNVGMALALQRKKEYKEEVARALSAVELDGYAKAKPNRLSGGQKQRVAIARAIVKRPKILLCDEPTGSLDEETGETIFALLKQISKSTLVVVVSHDREAAEAFGDRVIELRSGRVISDRVLSVIQEGQADACPEARETKGRKALPCAPFFVRIKEVSPFSAQFFDDGGRQCAHQREDEEHEVNVEVAVDVREIDLDQVDGFQPAHEKISEAECDQRRGEDAVCAFEVEEHPRETKDDRDHAQRYGERGKVFQHRRRVEDQGDQYEAGGHACKNVSDDVFFKIVKHVHLCSPFCCPLPGRIRTGRWGSEPECRWRRPDR